MPSAKPSNITAIVHKAFNLHQQGKFDKAEKYYRKVLKLDAKNFDALQGLGAIALQKKSYTQAIQFLESALQLQPLIPGLLTNLGLACQHSGNKEKARDYFERAIRADNTFGPAFYNLALLYDGEGRIQQALAALQEAERSRPGHIPTLTKLAQLLARLDYPKEAIDYYLHCLRLDPDNAQLHFELGNIYQTIRHNQEAVNALQKAISLSPDLYDAKAKLADVLESMNRLDEAKKIADNLLSLSPDQPLANLVLAKIERRDGKLETAKQRLQKVSAILSKNNANNDIHAGILTELGITLDRLGEYDEAFSAFSQANQQMAHLPSSKLVDPQRAFHIIENYRGWLNNKSKAVLITSAEFHTNDTLPTPIFLVGFPRSGTTLTEQILAAYENVTTADELPVLHQIVSNIGQILNSDCNSTSCLDTLDESAIIILRQYYWKQMTTALGNKILNRHFIDKMPLNIIHLGLIERIFPDAKIIVALRDPRDVCLSCFMQLFHVNESMAQFLDLSTTTKYYAAAMGLWLDYREKLQLNWMESRYEDIVSDLERSTTRLSDFLQLEKSGTTANFYQKAADRVISTPSYQDVTKPVYQRAVGRWQHYAKYLEPYINELEPFIQAFGYEQRV
jgi:tetratricopeptide (TPR) repeat protein